MKSLSLMNLGNGRRQNQMSGEQTGKSKGERESGQERDSVRSQSMKNS